LKFVRRALQTILALVGLMACLFVYTHFVLQKQVPKGNWFGTFTSPSGKRGALHLVITPHPSVEPDEEPMFDGVAQHCIGSPLSQDYKISGRIRSRGSSLTLTPSGSLLTGIRFSGLDVSWEDDTLTVSGHFVDYDGMSSAYNRANPDHAETAIVVLHKGADRDYQNACTQLK